MTLLRGERPSDARPKPTSFYGDPRAWRVVRHLHNLARTYQPAPLFAVGEVVSTVLADAYKGGSFETGGAEGLASVLAMGALGVAGFLNEQAVVDFSTEIAKYILIYRETPTKLLSNEGGRA